MRNKQLKNKLIIEKEKSNMREYLYCETAEEQFGKTNKASSYDGDVSVDYLTNNHTPLVTGAREYQREKVASLEFKQKLMLTVIENGFKRIPQIHIRVIKQGKAFRFELIDGQQRVTSIIDFVNKKFKLPNTKEFNLGNGKDVRGMGIEDIRHTYPEIYRRIFEYRISCVWYENLSDAVTAELFIKVLNNTNDMKPQEIRNAIRGFLSSFIRDNTRFEYHKLFDRVSYDSGRKVHIRLKHFSDNFTLSGRMEVDEWLSELIYLLENGYKNGITQAKHSKWIEDIQDSTGKISSEESFREFEEVVLEPLLNFSYKVITSVPKKYKYKLTPMVSQILILYGYELKNKYGKLIVEKYVKQFFKIYDKWSNTDSSKGKRHYLDEVMFGTKDEPMEPFNKLFGGKNKKAIGTIVYVLNKELENDEDSFGVIEIDYRNFTHSQIVQKWEEQKRKCFFTGEYLDLENIAGDHYIPRSWGIKKGGVTEMENLVVTSKELNNLKSSRHGDEFMEDIKKGLLEK